MKDYADGFGHGVTCMSLLILTFLILRMTGVL